MINSNAFDYINVLDKTADASWTRNEVLSNNIANVNTPNYKREDVAFERELERALGNSRYKSMDAKVADLKVNRLKARPYTDYSNFSYRMDGNNVDIDTENVTLAANQIKYQGVMLGINSEFTNLKNAMKSS
ncbi:MULTISPECIES: flagellar basal body rod protein FlgB [unclassified Butyrivibrio]|jgi:flagellar basal-body rod protein FlgB|uniref:flagellar basal body rod protein FlgB n=1 Tax=unclassified Butyrivibrio TaxID=2639466 RepID=UPI0003FF9A31|nr:MULTISPECIES: flagellar basal body rod protein FlgB [unclassified Butyrivibrio]